VLEGLVILEEAADDGEAVLGQFVDVVVGVVFGIAMPTAMTL